MSGLNAPASDSEPNPRLVPEYTLLKANVYLSKGKYHKAVNNYTQVLYKLWPGHPIAFLNRSLAYLCLHLPELAVFDAYRAAILAKRMQVKDKRGKSLYEITARYLDAEKSQIDIEETWTQPEHFYILKSRRLWAISDLASIVINEVDEGHVVQTFRPRKGVVGKWKRTAKDLQIRAIYRLCGALYECGGGSRHDALDLLEDSLNRERAMAVWEQNNFAFLGQIIFTEMMEPWDDSFHNFGDYRSIHKSPSGVIRSTQQAEQEMARLAGRKRVALLNLSNYVWDVYQPTLDDPAWQALLHRWAEVSLGACSPVVISQTDSETESRYIELRADRDIFAGELLLHEQSSSNVTTSIPEDVLESEPIGPFSARHFYCDTCSSALIVDEDCPVKYKARKVPPAVPDIRITSPTTASSGLSDVSVSSTPPSEIAQNQERLWREATPERSIAPEPLLDPFKDPEDTSAALNFQLSKSFDETMSPGRYPTVFDESESPQTVSSPPRSREESRPTVCLPRNSENGPPLFCPQPFKPVNQPRILEEDAFASPQESQIVTLGLPSSKLDTLSLLSPITNSPKPVLSSTTNIETDTVTLFSVLKSHPNEKTIKDTEREDGSLVPPASPRPHFCEVFTGFTGGSENQNPYLSPPISESDTRGRDVDLEFSLNDEMDWGSPEPTTESPSQPSPENPITPPKESPDPSDGVVPDFLFCCAEHLVPTCSPHCRKRAELFDPQLCKTSIESGVRNKLLGNPLPLTPMTIGERKARCLSYLLFLRIFAKAFNKHVHPLQESDIAFATCGPAHRGDIERISTWSFMSNVVRPLYYLDQFFEQTDMDQFAHLPICDGWMINTLMAKVEIAMRVTNAPRYIKFFDSDGMFTAAVTPFEKDFTDVLEQSIRASPPNNPAPRKYNKPWVGSIHPFFNMIRVADPDKGEKPNVLFVHREVMQCLAVGGDGKEPAIREGEPLLRVADGREQEGISGDWVRDLVFGMRGSQDEGQSDSGGHGEV